MTWKIALTHPAEAMLKAILDRRIQKKIRDRIDGLALEPEKQGKPLTGDLAGYRSLRTVGQRYRIIYGVYRNQVEVLVVAVGIRKEGSKGDVYALAKKLLRLGLLEPPQG
ncbi:MAG: type II toxin-antitoxin system RelE/ParE family toxin [Deinococcus sp.]|nr:type II toxin-antitoxin system RelE/ParE family toxin [Deinococcus sp.]